MPAPVTAFDEVLWPPDYGRGTSLGPTFRTIVIATESGADQRIVTSSVAIHRFEVQADQRSAIMHATLKAFFLCRTGRAFGFRFKDWADYQVTNEPLLVGAAGNPATGSPTVQLVKSYTSSPRTYVRNIYKPVASPAVTLRKNAGAFAGFTLDTTTGLVTLNALNTKAITAISAPGATTTLTVGASNGFAINDLVYITGVVGETQLNGLVGTVTASPGTTITVNINSTGFSTYISGGTATKYLTTTDTLDWTGQFDVPVRLDTDEMMVSYEDVDIRSWASVRLVELIA
jgi:uncharacterized protein (TIGR02217 family)